MLNYQALDKLKTFRNQEGNMIIFLLDTLSETIETTYGTDALVGFVLALDLVYFGLTGKNLEKTLEERMQQ